MWRHLKSLATAYWLAPLWKIAIQFAICCRPQKWLTLRQAAEKVTRHVSEERVKIPISPLTLRVTTGAVFQRTANLCITSSKMP